MGLPEETGPLKGRVAIPGESVHHWVGVPSFDLAQDKEGMTKKNDGLKMGLGIGIIAENVEANSEIDGVRRPDAA